MGKYSIIAHCYQFKIMRVAVIGTGNIGKHHIRIISEIPHAKLVGICDIDEKNVKILAKKYNSNPYTDFKKMIATENPVAVTICVPTSLHFEVAKYCIEKKIHVLVEKPITSNLKEAKELVRLAKINKVKLFVGHVERFNPAIRKLKSMIDNNELGSITAIVARRVGGFPPQIKDADIAIDLAIHDIDIVNYLLDETPKDVFVNKQKNHIKNRADSVEFFLKYKKASAYIQTNWITPVKIRKLNITGTEGYLELDYITQKIEFYKSNYNKFKDERNNFTDYILIFSDPDKLNITVGKKEPLKEEITYFIDCVKNDKKLDADFAVEALEIALKSE